MGETATWRSRQYGARDAETNWPAITWDESTIKAMVRELSTVVRDTASGRVTEQRGRMYTTSPVELRDQVIYNGYYWEIEDVQFKHVLLTELGYYNCTIIRLKQVSLILGDHGFNNIMLFAGLTPSINTSFSTPQSNVRGLTLDQTGALISCDAGKDSVYIHSGVTSSIVTSFSTPNGSPTGLTMSGSNLVSADSVNDSIYLHVGVTSTISTSFSSPNGYPSGLTIDEDGNLISSDYSSNSIYIHVGFTSTVSTSFSSPSTNPVDLSIDEDGNLVSMDDVSDSVYIHSGITSTILSSFSTGVASAWGLTLG